MFHIILAQQEHVKQIYTILENCSQWLLNQDMNHRKDVYTLEKIQQYVKNWEVYILTHNWEIVANIFLLDQKVHYYNEEIMQYRESPSERALYIKTLAVDPQYMQHWYGKQMMAFAENMAHKEWIKYLRLDALHGYEKLTKFYENIGYQIVWTKKLFPNYTGNFYEKKCQNG